ncbi:MAG TPA: peptidoglycan-associated lipoprotein Pal [Rhodanobacteraceae bacterium]|nr:peptidoglycan-associated lipoprotein Pal [Rhodanobacteraceae bacterium]
MNATVRVSVIALFCLAAAACAKKQEVKPAPPPEAPPTTSAPATTEGAFTPADLQTNACLRTRVIYFDFDKSDIKPQFDDIVACHAKYLRDRPMARMTIEGNTDERGSEEYNLGLGERRGNALASALEAQGASSDQIKVVSYGKTRPVCREHNESCWHLNRRDNIVYTTE